MEQSFTAATYQMLCELLDPQTELSVFQSYFTLDQNTGNYVCNNYPNYSAWLSEIGEDPSSSLFTAWDGYGIGKSQGSDVKP